VAIQHHFGGGLDDQKEMAVSTVIVGVAGCIHFLLTGITDHCKRFVIRDVSV
jgi:hypothetical protein